MTANRTEQKGGGSMAGITAEQRAALEAAGWRARDAGTYEAWEGGVYVLSLYESGPRNISRSDGKDVALAVALEVAAILGIAPAGHVVVPAEVVRTAHAALVSFAGSFDDIGNHVSAAEKRTAAQALNAALWRR